MRQKSLVTAFTGWVALFAAASLHAGVNQWTVKGPAGGDLVRDFDASSTNPDVFYVTYNRVLARSTDGAQTWQNIGNFTDEVVDIAVDPTDGNRIYVAVLEKGLFRSDNGGDSFVQIAAASNFIWAVGVGGGDGKTVYYTDGPGYFYRSQDRGATWSQRTSTPQGISRILVEGANGERILANFGDGLKRSNDGGDTWSDITIGSWVYGLVRVSASTLVADTAAGIYVSTDDAATWSLTYSGYTYCVARDPVTPTTLYAGSYFLNPLLRSTDSGAHWAPFGGNLPADPRGLAVTSKNGTTRFVAATLLGTFGSITGGQSWYESAPGPVASAPMQIVTTLAPDSRVYANTAGDGLFWTSMESDWQRIDLAPARAVTGVTPVGGSNLVVMPGQPRSIYMTAALRGAVRSTNGGTSWVQTGAGLENLPVTSLGVDPLDGSRMYAALSSYSSTPAASFYRSTDSGNTWKPQSVDLGPVYALQLAVDPANPQHILLASYQGYGPPNTGGLYQSLDGGVHWTERGFLNMNVRRIAIDPAETNRVYAATSLGLQVSADGGNSFTRNASLTTLSPLPVLAVAVDPVVPTTLYAAANDDGFASGPDKSALLVRSVDRGASWEVLRGETETPPWYFGDIVLDPNLPSLLYVSTGGRGIASFEIQNDLEATISGHSGTRQVGADASFTVHIRNNGALAATAVRLDLGLPAGLTFVQLTPTLGSCTLIGTPHCDVPVMRPGQSMDLVVQYRPPASMALPVTAQISAHERDNVSSNDIARASALAGEVVDLRVNLVPSLVTVDHGDPVTYEARLTNDGPLTASRATVTFTPGPGLTMNTVPTECAAALTGQLLCVVDNLAMGESRTISFGTTTSAAGSLTSTATVAAAASAADTNSANNSATTTITSRPVADLAVTATDSADPVRTATAFSYTAEVRNNGPDEATAATATLTAAGGATSATTSRGSCTIAGTGVNCTLGALASGASATITVNTAVATSGTNTMHVVVASGVTDKVPDNNSADQATVITDPPVSSSSSGGGSSGSSGGGKGGGGTVDAGWLALALGLLLMRRRQPRGVAPRS